jgi:hypothetical protein
MRTTETPTKVSVIGTLVLGALSIAGAFVVLFALDNPAAFALFMALGVILCTQGVERDRRRTGEAMTLASLAKRDRRRMGEVVTLASLAKMDERQRLQVPWPANWPSPVDRLPVLPDEPEGWHVRATMLDGYPLMGSSPAERAESEQRAQRIKRQAMRDHVFLPSERDPRYCGLMLGGKPVTGAAGDQLAVLVECGYPVDAHPWAQRR